MRLIVTPDKLSSEILKKNNKSLFTKKKKNPSQVYNAPRYNCVSPHPIPLSQLEFMPYIKLQLR